MAIQTVYVCDAPFDNQGRCSGNEIELIVDNDLATALLTHAEALDLNTSAMEDFFTLSTDDVGLISAMVLVAFIIGNSAGKVASIMRKT